jgi:lipid II:glycine glycyltransferase (peptidoglycan interpeptide bridge formation enzyme)
LAQKKEIEISIIEKPTNQQFEEFWRLMKKTSERDKFFLHPRDYYKKMLKDFSCAKLVAATHKGQMISVKILVFFGDTVTYLHGASDYDFRPLMAPYLSQWFSIQEAKKRGYKFYDFWGINEQRWPGITRFKRGFGGQEISYPQAHDVVFQPKWYYVYNLIKKIR